MSLEVRDLEAGDRSGWEPLRLAHLPFHDRVATFAEYRRDDIEL